MYHTFILFVIFMQIQWTWWRDLHIQPVQRSPHPQLSPVRLHLLPLRPPLRRWCPGLFQLPCTTSKSQDSDSFETPKRHKRPKVQDFESKIVKLWENLKHLNTSGRIKGHPWFGWACGRPWKPNAAKMAETSHTACGATTQRSEDGAEIQVPGKHH